MIYIPLSAIIDLKQLGISETAVDALHQQVITAYHTTPEDAAILTSCIIGTLESVKAKADLREQDAVVYYKNVPLHNLLPGQDIFEQYRQLVTGDHIYPARSLFVMAFAQRMEQP